jgi:integrase
MRLIADRLQTREISPTAALTMLTDIANPKPTAADGPTVAQCANDFLAAKKAEIGVEISEGRWSNLARGVEHFCKTFGPQPINRVTGDTLAAYRTELMGWVGSGKIGHAYAKDYICNAKQFVRWCCETERLEKVPRNLDSRTLSITIPPKEVETFTPDEIKSLLARTTKRVRLYTLLALNCGMTQQDVSDLAHREIDWTTGMITRKRSKTVKIKNCPVVTYKLWDTTLALLRELATTKGDRVLTNREGQELVRTEMRGGKYTATDCIKRSWELLKAPKSFKYLRKTSATLLASHKDFNSVAGLFLGHSATTIQEKHYTKPAQEILADGLAWLATQYGVE